MVKKSKDNNQNQQSSSDKESDALWMRHGIDDVYYQRDAHVNFWTVLGGIAVAALLTQVSNLVTEIQLGKWYLLLYFLTSITLIANSWIQSLWSSLVLKAQVTILHTLLGLLHLICLSIICIYVTNPIIFFASCGFLVLIVLAIQLYFMKTGGWVAFTEERIKGIKTVIWVYLGFLIFCCIATVHLFWYPSVLAEIGWGIFAILASISALVMQHNGMKREREDLKIP